MHSLRILDTDPEPAYDDLVVLAARIAGVPTSLVSLIDTERQWFKARIGMDVRSTGRDIAFCDHVVRAQTELEVRDARLDPRFQTTRWSSDLRTSSSTPGSRSSRERA